MPFWLIDAFCLPEVQKSFFSWAHGYLHNRASLTPLQYLPICILRYSPLHQWSLQLMDLQYRASKSTSHPYPNALFSSQNFWVRSSQSFVLVLDVGYWFSTLLKPPWVRLLQFFLLLGFSPLELLARFSQKVLVFWSKGILVVTL